MIQNNQLQDLINNAENAVILLKKMAHIDRLLILCHLSDGEISAGELSRRSHLSQSAFSQHLAILRREQLISTRRESQTIFYSLSNSQVVDVLRVLKQVFCQDIGGDLE